MPRQRAQFSPGWGPKEVRVEDGKVKVDASGVTSIPRVSAAGDIVNLNLDAVTGIADAKMAPD